MKIWNQKDKNWSVNHGFYSTYHPLKTPEVVAEIDWMKWGANITNRGKDAVSVTFQRQQVTNKGRVKQFFQASTMAFANALVEYLGYHLKKEAC